MSLNMKIKAIVCAALLGLSAGLAAQKRGVRRMSAQAVGGAVGHNPVSVIVPCHRVVGAGGSLIGYAGGLDLKSRLLTFEGIAVEDDRIIC